MTDGIVLGDDGVARCWWADSAPEYRAYHDREWGFPVADDDRLFEKLSLEGFQSGLSWLTILRKRDAFRRAFAGFDFDVVARFDEQDVARLLADASIVRHRGKIEAVINNAGRAVEMVSECGSLAAFLWGFEPTPRAGGSAPRRDRGPHRGVARTREGAKAAAAGGSSDPPRCTRSCRPWAWSTITWKAAPRGPGRAGPRAVQAAYSSLTIAVIPTTTITARSAAGGRRRP